ncbi:MAG: MFS transporter [Nitrososphaera sp.]
MLLDWITNDGKLIISTRIVRAFAYGFLSIVLATYLKLIGINDLVIGLILTATLVNSVIFTLLASIYADRVGRRKMLIIYAVLMSISGTIFVVTDNYVILIIAALIGTINVTGSETGPFLSVEQALISQTVSDHKKINTMFALYNMAGTFAMSAGILLSGLPDILQQQYQLNQVDAIKPLFLIYSIFGVILVGVYFSMSNKIELSRIDAAKPLSRTLSPKSKKIVGKLSGLFAVDSFA